MDDKLVDDVKIYLGITTDDAEVTNNIKLKAIATMQYLKNAGMKNVDGICSEESISCIAIGVNDLLNNKAGDTKFSPAFNMLAMQLCRR